MEYKKPLVVQFQPGNGAHNDRQVHQNGDVLEVPNMLRSYNQFREALRQNLSVDRPEDQSFDSVLVTYKPFDGELLNNPKTIESLNIKTKSVLKEAKQTDKPVYNFYDGQLYDLSSDYEKLKNDGHEFVMDNDTVLNKRNQYDKLGWEHHQAEVFQHFKAIMPLTTGGKFDRSDHVSELTAPKRGLKPNDLKDFFSWQPNQTVIPELMQDNMVGMPSIKALDMQTDQVSFHGRPFAKQPIHLQTVGKSGYMIPMKNLNGDSPKYQIGTDITKINVVLKARAKDGTSIQKSEYLPRKGPQRNIYQFKMDGQPSNLTVDSINKDGSIKMKDNKGTFDIAVKDDVKDTLVDRGYELPPIIDSITPVPASKYIWMSLGDMVGNEDINNSKSKDPKDNMITPSECGFIEARKPKNGNDHYVMVMAEGALKGVITAKYMNHPDENGVSLGDKIAGDRGVIIAQVPGVALSFAKSTERVYEDPRLKDKIDGTYIAWDADGRKNKAVANGINDAYAELKQYNNGKVAVMSWDPKQKGIDDSLLAVANHKINIKTMGIHFGTAAKLFPRDQAKAPNPYKLDGTHANHVEWVEDYAESKAEQAKRLDRLQRRPNNSKDAPEKKDPENKDPENKDPENKDPKGNNFDLDDLDDLDPKGPKL